MKTSILVATALCLAIPGVGHADNPGRSGGAAWIGTGLCASRNVTLLHAPYSGGGNEMSGFGTISFFRSNSPNTCTTTAQPVYHVTGKMYWARFIASGQYAWCREASDFDDGVGDSLSNNRNVQQTRFDVASGQTIGSRWAPTPQPSPLNPNPAPGRNYCTMSGGPELTTGASVLVRMVAYVYRYSTDLAANTPYVFTWDGAGHAWV